MKLILSIIHSEDSRKLIDALMRDGHRATVISTTGGFLREGNATIIVGTEDETVEKVLAIIRENCHTRRRFVNPLPPIIAPGEMHLPTPVEVEVGGATVFVMDVSRSERY